VSEISWKGHQEYYGKIIKKMPEGFTDIVKKLDKDHGITEQHLKTFVWNLGRVLAEYNKHIPEVDLTKLRKRELGFILQILETDMKDNDNPLTIIKKIQEMDPEKVKSMKQKLTNPGFLEDMADKAVTTMEKIRNRTEKGIDHVTFYHPEEEWKVPYLKQEEYKAPVKIQKAILIARDEAKKRSIDPFLRKGKTKTKEPVKKKQEGGPLDRFL
jgi:hypothetical protein